MVHTEDIWDYVSHILVTMSRAEAFNWFSKYSSEVTNVKDAECWWPTSISKTYKDVARITDHIHANRDSPSTMRLMGWEPHQVHAKAFWNQIGTSDTLSQNLCLVCWAMRKRRIMSMCARSFKINFNKETPSSFKAHHRWQSMGTTTKKSIDLPMELFTLSPKEVQTSLF